MRYSFLFLLVFPFISIAQSTSIDRDVASVSLKVVQWRRHLHQHPELSNREYNTSAYIISHLKSLGIETRKIAKTV